MFATFNALTVILSSSDISNTRNIRMHYDQQVHQPMQFVHRSLITVNLTSRLSLMRHFCVTRIHCSVLSARQKQTIHRHYSIHAAMCSVYQVVKPKRNLVG